MLDEGCTRFGYAAGETVAAFEEALYVLHAFEKRTQKTRAADIELGQKRLAAVQRARKR